MGARMICGDMRAVLATMDPDSVDAVICDPPYELGFMGRKWDSSGVAFDPETWAAALRVAKPGAHLAAFGGSRTWHRIAVAIEDAGWDIRDSLIWWYAQGFPKSLDVSKAIDAAAGVERGRNPDTRNGPNTNHATKGKQAIVGGYAGAKEVDAGPITDAARKWAGWGTALKPAFEPIILARKPLAGTVAANVQRYGTGAINVDGCRVGFGSGPMGSWGTGTREGGFADVGASLGDGRANGHKNDAGRWPPNMLVSHADECVEGAPCVEGCPAPMFGERLSTFPAFYAPKASRSEREAGCDALPARAVNPAVVGKPWENNPRAGAGRDGERKNHHPTVKPISVMRWLCKLLTPPGGLILDPFAGSGTTGCAAVLEGFDFLGIDLDPAHVVIAEARIDHNVRQASVARQCDMFEVP